MKPIPWSERKRREREERILAEAYRMMLEEGYLGLNLDRLAKEVGCAKGTLFLHFSSKEDILLALTVRTMRLRRALFEHAAGFVGRPREQMCAIAVADQWFVTHYTGHFKIEFLVTANSLWEKASPEHQAEFDRWENSCKDVVAGIVRRAIQIGDLRPGLVTPEEVSFGLWTMSLGMHTLVAAARRPLHQVGISSPHETFRRNAHAMLDGLGWQPLFHDWDYAQTYRKIEDQVDAYRRLALEIFPDDLSS